MKKILILNTTFDKGGAARIAQGLFLRFKNEGDFSIFFAYGRGKKSTEANTFYFGNKIETLLHILLVRFLGLEGFGNYFSTKKLIRFIEKEKIDLVHIHNLHGYYLNFFKLLNYLNEKNIKVVWTLHDEWVFTWLPAHSIDCKHCKTLIGKCTNTYKYPRNYLPLFADYMLAKKRGILTYKNISFISPAPWLYNEAKNEFNLSNIKLIPNWIDSNIFVPTDAKDILRKKYSLPDNKKIILLSSNNLNNKDKGSQYILELAKLLLNKPYILAVVGGAKLPQKENVFSFGYVSNQKDLAQIYSLSDIYCTLSAVETAPLSVLEAMSCGLPIVGFKIKALEGVTDERNSRLVEYGNKTKLVETISEILDTSDLIKTLGQNSRDIILNNFNQEKSYSLYKSTYQA